MQTHSSSKLRVTLLPNYREPRICLKCNSKKAINAYESGRFSWRLFFFKPTLLHVGTGAKEFAWYCKKCDFARAITSRLPLWWVTCLKCNLTLVNKTKDLCHNCETA